MIANVSHDKLHVGADPVSKLICPHGDYNNLKVKNRDNETYQINFSFNLNFFSIIWM